MKNIKKSILSNSFQRLQVVANPGKLRRAREGSDLVPAAKVSPETKPFNHPRTLKIYILYIYFCIFGAEE